MRSPPSAQSDRLDLLNSVLVHPSLVRLGNLSGDINQEIQR